MLQVLLAGLALSLIPWLIAAAVLLANRRTLRNLEARLERLERSRGIEPAPPAVAPAAPPPFAAPSPAPKVAGTTGAPSAPIPAPGPHPAIPTVVPASPPTRDSRRLEEQVGGIWMQNVGSVLLLLGAFFLIVWGYANGRIGPEALVAAGVALGIVLAWRGNVIARTLKALGNALIGVGLGVVYITLYLGHFRMHVLPAWSAFGLLTLVSLITVAIGLRRREPIIATLGVIGAFVPQLLAVWVPPEGFRLPTPALLGYFAVVNAVVFALAATVGWSGLVILSLLLTSITWMAGARPAWGFEIQLGLSALFTSLGLAPAIRLVRSPLRVRSVDLAVVALAPILLLLCSAPFLAAPDRLRASQLLVGLAAVYIASAVWVDSLRAERDLWKPLTGAATVFLAAAIERGIVGDYLALAWWAQGAVLVWLGLARGGGWLRGLGYAVLLVSSVRLWLDIFLGHWDAAAVLPGGAVRDLLSVLAFLALSHVIGRKRSALSPSERFIPGAAVFSSNALLMQWMFREAGQVAPYLRGSGGGGLEATSLPLAAAAWLAQALVLILLAARRDAPVLRRAGYAVAGCAMMLLLVVFSLPDPWRRGVSPVWNAPTLLLAAAAGLLLAIAEVLWRHRSRLADSERRMPEIATGAANLMLLPWWGREARHLAASMASGGVGISGSVGVLAAVITSAAWTLQAIILFALGWLRESPFLRWSGLALFGLTVLKFLLVDLDRVDAFWRFVSALGIGAALLVVSFLYQRRARRLGVAAGVDPTTPR